MSEFYRPLLIRDVLRTLPALGLYDKRDAIHQGRILSGLVNLAGASTGTKAAFIQTGTEFRQEFDNSLLPSGFTNLAASSAARSKVLDLSERITTFWEPEPLVEGDVIDIVRDCSVCFLQPADAQSTYTANQETAENQLKNQRHIDERASIGDPNQILSLPLWSDFKKEYGLSLCYDELCRFWDSDPERWSFWRLWYDGYIIGTPLNSSVVSTALRLHPDQLVGSVESVSKRINVKGTGAFLISQIENIYNIFKSSENIIVDRWHNQPPSRLASSDEVTSLFVKVLQRLKEADKELSNSAPNLSTLSIIGQALRDAALSLAAYVGTLTDVALKKAAEELGSTGTKWTIRAGVGIYAARSEPVRLGLEKLPENVVEFSKIIQGF